MTKAKLTICMGSSCFSRGNNKNLTLIQEYLQKNKLAHEIDLSGCLCQDECNYGPQLTINGIIYNNVEPNTVLDILEHTLKGD